MVERNRIPIETDGHPDETVRFQVAIRLLVPARKVKEALSALSAMVERIRVKEGCLGCRLYKEVVGGRTLLFEVIWAGQKSFQRYLRSEEFRYVLLVVEMARTAPEIRFERVARSTHIDPAEDVRKWAETLAGGKSLSV